MPEPTTILVQEIESRPATPVTVLYECESCYCLMATPAHRTSGGHFQCGRCAPQPY